jgi:hypothetical protein
MLCGRTRFRRKHGCPVPFSCFALPESFPAIPRASCNIFKFCAPGLIFGGTEGVRSHFHVWRSQTCFLRCRVRRVPFSCFVCPDSLSTVSRATGPVLKFCAPELFFDRTEVVWFSFQVLCSQTSFRRCRVRRVPFSSIARPNSFSTISRASGPVFMFCNPRLIFVRTASIGSRFHVLRFRIRFQRYRGRQVPFSCFALLDSFSVVPRTSGPVFIFCTPQIHFRRYRERPVTFSCFAPPDIFSAVSSASGHVFIFCKPRLVSAVLRATGPVFKF